MEIWNGGLEVYPFSCNMFELLRIMKKDNLTLDYIIECIQNQDMAGFNVPMWDLAAFQNLICYFRKFERPFKLVAAIREIQTVLDKLDIK